MAAHRSCCRHTNPSGCGPAINIFSAHAHANAQANPNAVVAGLYTCVNSNYCYCNTGGDLSLVWNDMMKPKRETSKAIIRVLLVLFILLAFLQDTPVISSGLPSEGPKRSVSISTDYTIYEWWLLDWKNSDLVCQIYTESEAIPDYSQVLHYCGSAVQQRWIDTKPCVFQGGISSPQDCPGLYMHLVHTTPSKREVEVLLPSPEVWVSIAGCDKSRQKNHCSQVPYLRLQATEPLPNEQIIQIVGRINNASFTCPGAICDLPPLSPPTGMNGSLVEFWAESSYGDASPIFTAQVRVIPWAILPTRMEIRPTSPAIMWTF